MGWTRKTGRRRRSFACDQRWRGSDRRTWRGNQLCRLAVDLRPVPGKTGVSVYARHGMFRHGHGSWRRRSSFKVGDRVMALTGTGAYAEEVVIDANRVY